MEQAYAYHRLMLYRCRFPRPPLSEFVEQIWLYGGYSVPHSRERLMPTGTTELVINLGTGMAVVAGVYSRPAFIETTDMSAGILGIHFRPGGAFPFFGVPAHALHNETVELESLWGSDAALLRERVLSAANDEMRFDILENELMRRARTLEHHRAVSHGLFRLGRCSTVADVVEETGLSQRRFIQLFDGEVGITPKVYSRVTRFQRVLRRVHALDDVDWSDVAMAAGYYDQSHLIHEFASLAGITPSQYFARKTEHLNHVPAD